MTRKRRFRAVAVERFTAALHALGTDSDSVISTVAPIGTAAPRIAVSMAALLLGIVLLVVLVLEHSLSTQAGFAVVATAVGLGGLAREMVPTVRATRRRAARIGALPGFVSRLTLGMRVTPTLEHGVATAFRTDGPLTRHVTTTPGQTPEAVLEAAFDALGPHAERVEGLLTAAPTATDHHVLLDRAIDTVLDGTRTRMRAYAAGLQGPITALYAFGVVLPLALVGILPAAPIAGFDLPLVVLALGLDIVLPVALVAGTVWLVARRPTVHRRPTIRPPYAELGSPAAVSFTVVAAGFFGALIGLAFTDWAVWFVPIAWGVGGALLTRYHGVLPALESRQQLHEAVPDLLALVGDAMADGDPPETALQRAAGVPGTAGEIAKEADAVRRRFGVSVQDALLGDHGPLSVLESRQTDTLGGLLAITATSGRAGGRALARYADHLDDLHDLDREIRADLARLTGSLRQTAALYAPMIAGVTVALATRLQSTAESLTPPGPGFALVVGGYVLVLAVVLPATATAVTQGWCRVRTGTAVGRSLLLAGVLFPATAHAAALLL